jgi:hypothetical protein
MDRGDMGLTYGQEYKSWIWKLAETKDKFWPKGMSVHKTICGKNSRFSCDYLMVACGF